MQIVYFVHVGNNESKSPIHSLSAAGLWTGRREEGKARRGGGTLEQKETLIVLLAATRTEVECDHIIASIYQLKGEVILHRDLSPMHS